MDTEKVLKIYTRLKSLKQNLPDGPEINEKYVNEFNHLVDELSKEVNNDLVGFLVPENELRPIINYIAMGITEHSKDRWAERGIFLSKLDAILSYFEIKYLSEGEKQVGFQPPK